MIIFTILFYDRMNFILFYPRSTFSYMSKKISSDWDLDSEMLDTSMYVSEPIRVSICVDQFYGA